MTNAAEHLGKTFPVCRKILGGEKWRAAAGSAAPADLQDFPALLTRKRDRLNLPPWLPDLARLEAAVADALSLVAELDAVPVEICHNPTLSVIGSEWSGLAQMLTRQVPAGYEPGPGHEVILVWLKPGERKPEVRPATAEELLALKMIVEGLDKQEIVSSGQASLAVIDRAIALAAARGILLAPPSALRRDRSVFAGSGDIPEKFLAARTFTLQWHITQACDLHCKHCYDRSDRYPLALGDAEKILDQFYDFCRSRHVEGQVSFTGGNPLLHPDFLEIYRAAADRGLMTAILGNPTSPEILAGINKIRKPEFFQVSLEGLEEHNDFIRGAGHFRKILPFLEELRRAGIYSMVMLTLTRSNLTQVLPLGELLRDRADLFTFNRLSAVGEGALLQTPERGEYEAFLEEYLAAAPDNPAMALKDNLINIIRERRGEKLFGGCAGFGCGAAFNFVALLPEGEVHACRKFPSPIGNIHRNSLAEIYDSDAARRCRQGPEDCRGCRIRHVCGGCLAVISSQGLDIGKDRDPSCFIEQAPS